jgi:hypothetical protein
MRVTKNIFLDTSAIVAQNFDFRSPALVALEKLARDGEARLLVTSITIREVESNIRDRIATAETALTRVKTNHPILKNIPDISVQAILAPFDAARAAGQLIDAFSEYRQRTGTEIVPLTSASAEEVFDSYFARRPPFGDGKKKSEFPDAFTISALESWCRSRKEKAYVAATDPDVAGFCENSEWLVHLARAGEYVELFHRESAAMRLVEESAQERVEDLTGSISRAFEGCGFYLHDLEGDVNGVDVLDVEIEELSLLKVEAAVAQFEVTAAIKFLAEISYDDPESGFWDSEDKVMIGMETVNAEVERTVEVTLTADVKLSPEGRYDSVTSVQFPDRDFGVNAIDDGYPYK